MDVQNQTNPVERCKPTQPKIAKNCVRANFSLNRVVLFSLRFLFCHLNQIAGYWVQTLGQCSHDRVLARRIVRFYVPWHLNRASMIPLFHMLFAVFPLFSLFSLFFCWFPLFFLCFLCFFCLVPMFYLYFLYLYLSTLSTT